MTTPQHVTGAQFHDMLIKAGHTKGYLSMAMKKGLQNMKLENGKKASAVIYDKHMHVDRHDAVKIIKKFKEAGLAHGVVGHAEEFVRHNFQEAHQQGVDADKPNAAALDPKKAEMIKRQNLAEHAKSIEAEKAKEAAAAAAPKNASAKKMATPVQLARNIVSSIGNKPAASDSSPTTLTAMTISNTSAPHPSSPNNTNLNQQPEEELIDMAID